MEPSITPTPTEDEVAAIVAAMEELWPRAIVEQPDDVRRPSVWRFSGRWWSQPIPLRRPRPWV
jgi:hypothetical protein